MRTFVAHVTQDSHTTHVGHGRATPARSLPSVPSLLRLLHYTRRTTHDASTYQPAQPQHDERRRNCRRTAPPRTPRPASRWKGWLPAHRYRPPPIIVSSSSRLSCRPLTPPPAHMLPALGTEGKPSPDIPRGTHHCVRALSVAPSLSPPLLSLFASSSLSASLSLSASPSLSLYFSHAYACHLSSSATSALAPGLSAKNLAVSI